MSDISSDMAAAFIRRRGGIDEIEFGRLPVPVCGPQDVLSRVEALAVNHVDTFVRSGAYATELPMPFVIGRDFVGLVVARGEQVTGPALGDRVWCNSLGYAGRQGTFAEYALAPANRVYALPAGQDPAEVVSLLHTCATACLGLFREGALSCGETVFVGGAGGGVGSATVQLAATTGARVIATTSAADLDWVRSCGAEEVFDYRDPTVADRIAQAAPRGIDVYWDHSGRYDFEHSLPRMALGGRIIVSAGLGASPTLPIGALYTQDVSLRGFAISNASVEDLADAAMRINRSLSADKLKARIGLRLPLRDAASAHRFEEMQGPERIRGRIVVVP